MGGLFEFIMDNIFIVIIIVSAILGLFRNNAAEEEKKKQNNRPKTAPNPVSRGGQQPRQRVPQQVSRQNKPNNEKQLTTLSVEEQQREQIERLTSQYIQKENDSSHHAFSNKSLMTPVEELTKQEADYKKQLSENLNRKGLINGIIMSEVLGPPRARKPYQSIIKERRNSQ